MDEVEWTSAQWTTIRDKEGGGGFRYWVCQGKGGGKGGGETLVLLDGRLRFGGNVAAG